MEGEHEHEPQVPVITPVIEAGEKELVAPVIDHTEKITRIEERQSRHEEDILRQIGELESRLSEASQSQANSIYERIAGLEGKLENLVEKAPPEAPIPESVELTLPDVETSPAPPEKMRQGLSHRRKAKRKREK